MGSVQVTLVASVVTTVNIPNPTYRIIATMISAVAEAYVTADGTTPAIPTSAPTTSTQTVIAPVAGFQASVRPILPGSAATGSVASGGVGPGGSILPVVQLLSAGTPVIELEW